MSDQRVIEQAHIARLAQALTSAVMEGDFQQVRRLIESDHEENVRAAASRLVNTGLTGERLAAGRQYIQGVLLEASNRRIAESLAAVGPTIATLNAGLDRVNTGLEKVDGSVRTLDASSTRLGRTALWVAVVVALFTLVQGIAAGMQIWKWVVGK